MTTSWGKTIGALALAGVILAALAFASLTVVEAFLQSQFAGRLYAEVSRRPPHPFLQVTAAAQVPTNEAGFRGEPLDVSPTTDTFRVFTLGGSTTLGVSNPYEGSYPYLLQKLLRRQYPHVTIQVQNAGVAWYSTAHILINYELRVRQYAPDLVIVFEAINDLYRGFDVPWFTSGPFKSDYSNFVGPFARFQGPDVDTVSTQHVLPGSTSLWWQSIRRVMGRNPSPYSQNQRNVSAVATRLHPREVKQFRSLPSYRDYYGRLIRHLSTDKRRVLVASQPFLYSTTLTSDDRGRIYYPQLFCAEAGDYPTMESMIGGMKQFNDASRDLANAAGVPYVDFEAAVPKSGEFFTDDVHMNTEGNERIARKAFEWMVQNRVVEEWMAARRGAAPPPPAPVEHR